MKTPTLTRAEFLAFITTEHVTINGNAVESLSEAVLATAHVADGTEPPGIECSTTPSALRCWDSLSNRDRFALWQEACAGVLDTIEMQSADRQRLQVA